MNSICVERGLRPDDLVSDVDLASLAAYRVSFGPRFEVDALPGRGSAKEQDRQAALAIPPVPVGSPPPGPGIVRECPHCKEPMRRDANVCPHCRRESPAWEYEPSDRRWWASDSDGGRMWFDEKEGTLRRVAIDATTHPQE